VNTSTATLQNLRTRQTNFYKKHKNQGLSVRIQHLKKLNRVLETREKDIFEALYKDLKKPAFESLTSETIFVQKEISTQIKNLKYWSLARPVKSSWINFPSRDYLLPEPYGNILMISPWNYPFQLAMTPMVGAVAAGNTVVLKPSEAAPHTAQIIKEICAEVFPEDWVAVVEGEVETASALLKMPWDYIFFTGSTSVGRIVARAAAEHLTPVTLELGGKSPCIVDASAPIKTTAKRIVWGKFLNCGQTCIAPDYLLVEKSIKPALTEALIEEIKKAFGADSQQSEDYGRIIHSKHFNKLIDSLKDQKVLFGGNHIAENLFIAPTLVDQPPLDSPLMREEIFGPILPILVYEKESEIAEIVNSLDKPLSFYVFSKRKKFIDSLLKTYSYGGAVVNDTLVHFGNDHLPFGGIGSSGMGVYHGRHSFELFTHLKPIVKRSFWFDLPQRYAPYPKSLALLKILLKRL